MFSLSGHIGAKVSALVDGQLSSVEEERAWSHVLACPGCRRLVEHEGWTKRQLGLLSDEPPRQSAPPAQLVGSLYDVGAWATVDGIERRSTRRRAAVVLVGGGAFGAAVFGLVAVTGPTLGGEVPTRPSPATIRGDAPGTTTGSSTGAEASIPAALVRRTR